MVERIFSSATMESVEVIGRAAEARLASTAGPDAVRYLGRAFIPAESRFRCLFEAANADLVRALNDTAQLPYRRIILALDLESTPKSPYTGEDR